MTKGRSGKLVASWSLAWNSSMVSVEFCGDSPGSAPLAVAPRLPCTPQEDALLFLPHFCSSATLEGKPRSRENHAQGNASTRDPTLHRAVQIPGDAGKTAPIFPGFRSIQH